MEFVKVAAVDEDKLYIRAEAKSAVRISFYRDLQK